MWFRRHMLAICITLAVIILFVGTLSILGFLSINLSLILTYLTAILGVLISAIQLIQSSPPANQPLPPPPPRRSFFSLGTLILLVVLCFLFLPLMMYAGYYSTIYINSTCDNFAIYQPKEVFHLDSGALPTHVDRTSDNECVGISDGDFAFDTLRPNGTTKLLAAMNFRSNSSEHADKAVALLKKASKMESNDAEPLIYMEDQSVLKDYTSFNRQYYDVIAVTMLTGSSDSVNIGRDNLQGFYAAQKEYNDQQNKTRYGPKLRLLIANIGDSSQFSSIVEQQIENVAKADHDHFIGVVGWPMSSTQAISAVKQLNAAQLTTISPTASADTLTANPAQYFFRVSPSNQQQVKYGAAYAQSYFQGKAWTSIKLDVFYDSSTNFEYSTNLDTDMKAQGYCTTNCREVPYNNQDDVFSIVKKAIENDQPAMVYFAGYANEGLLALSALKAANYTNLFLGGDALYQLRSSFFEMYPPFANSMLRFTAFVYPDEPIPALATFNSLYRGIFGADQKEHPSPYGFTRADNDAILSYDALLTLRTALNQLGSNAVSTQALRNVLVTINKNNPVPGASGPIYFVGADGHASSDAQNKKVLVICVDPNGRGYPCG